MPPMVPPDKNQHVLDFLSHYIELPYPPYYAVLLTGPWGIGKTYLIKKFLKEKFPDESKYAYVSLYGVATREELDMAVFQACFPNVIWKNVELLGRVGKTALKFVGVNPDVQLSGLPKPDKQLYVFDDLERCEMPINRSLGYINEFLEHENKKVVIVANEQEIDNKNEYIRRREKLIGKTFEIQSVLDEALASFITPIADPAGKSLLDTQKEHISTVYNQSGLYNLRILQQTIWDFCRFFGALGKRHRENHEGVTTLLRSFFALSFEFKAGRLRKEHLKDWFSSHMEYEILRHDKDRDGGTERQQSPCEIAIARYPDIDLSVTFLSPKLIEDLFVKGIVEYSEIQAYLDNNSPYFVDKGTEAPWRTVWHYTERTEEEFTRAYTEMEQQFAERKILHPGELLHVFGLRFLLAKIGLLTESRRTLVCEGKKYIDGLYSAKQLQPLEVHQSEDTLSGGGYAGLGIYEGDSAELRELDAYLEAKRKQARIDKYPDDALVLLQTMKDNPSLYVRRLCLTNSEDNWFYRIPILSAMKPHDFVTSLLQQSPYNQFIILSVFKRRYEHGELREGGTLAAEKPWLRLVHDKLLEKAAGMSPMGKYRLTSWVKRFIAPCISDGSDHEAAV